MRARRGLRKIKHKLWHRRLASATSLAQINDLSGGDLSVHARHLGTGAMLSHNADRPCKLASVVKLPLAVRVLACVDEGRFELSDVVDVEPRHVCPGSGVIASRLRVPGVSLSVGNLLRLALAESDNTATDALFEQAGGPGAVQQAVAEWGHSEIRVDRTIRAMLGDLFGIRIEDGHDPATVLRDAEPTEALALAFFADRLDTATPRAVADLLADLFAGKLLSQESTAWLVTVLSTCKTGRRRFRLRLAAGAVVAQKTGTLWARGKGRMVADAAVLRLPSGDHAAAVAFLTGSPRPRADQEVVLAQVAQVVSREI